MWHFQTQLYCIGSSGLQSRLTAREIATAMLGGWSDWLKETWEVLETDIGSKEVVKNWCETEMESLRVVAMDIYISDMEVSYDEQWELLNLMDFSTSLRFMTPYGICLLQALPLPRRHFNWDEKKPKWQQHKTTCVQVFKKLSDIHQSHTSQNGMGSHPKCDWQIHAVIKAGCPTSLH